MKRTTLFAILLALMHISGCTTIPVVDSNWIESKCQSIGYFTPDTNEKSSCYLEDITSGIYNCPKTNGDKYVGQLKDSEMHGTCEYIWAKDGETFKGTCKDGEFWCGITRRGKTFATVKNGVVGEHQTSGIDWETVGAAVLIAGAIYVAAELAEDGGGGYSDNDYKYTCKYRVNGVEIERDAVYGSCPDVYYEEPLMCYRDAVYTFTRYCDEKACGDSCISTWKTCHVGRGTACNKNDRGYP